MKKNMIFKSPLHLKANKLLTHLIRLHNKENIYIACSYKILCKFFILKQRFFLCIATCFENASILRLS
jgi:hypothetical protein